MQYNNTKDTTNLLLIFSSDVYSIEEADLENNLKEVTIYYDRHTRHQYHVISQFVNNKMSESEDAISYILNNIDGMLAFLVYRREICEEIISSNSKLNANDIILNLEKLYDHIALEEERIKNNATIIRNSNEQIERNVINTFNSIMDSFQNKVDEISNSLNANIITVVGLFSAIIFVFFGGITTLSNLIDGVWKIKTKEDLRIPLIIIMAVGFIIFNIVFLLLYSISKIVDKNIGSSVTGWNGRWYWVEEIKEGCYGVFHDDKLIGKCYRNKNKAEKIANRKIFLSHIKADIQQNAKKIFLRFPYVVIINVILLAGIIYFYIKL